MADYTQKTTFPHQDRGWLTICQALASSFLCDVKHKTNSAAFQQCDEKSFFMLQRCEQKSLDEKIALTEALIKKINSGIVETQESQNSCGERITTGGTYQLRNGFDGFLQGLKPQQICAVTPNTWKVRVVKIFKNEKKQNSELAMVIYLNEQEQPVNAGFIGLEKLSPVKSL